jgi:hypothetical protein
MQDECSIFRKFIHGLKIETHHLYICGPEAITQHFFDPQNVNAVNGTKVRVAKYLAPGLPTYCYF